LVKFYLSPKEFIGLHNFFPQKNILLKEIGENFVSKYTLKVFFLLGFFNLLEKTVVYPIVNQ